MPRCFVSPLGNPELVNIRHPAEFREQRTGQFVVKMIGIVAILRVRVIDKKQVACLIHKQFVYQENRLWESLRFLAGRRKIAL